MGKLSNYTLAGIEAQLYPTRAAEFRRGKDKKKRKSRSLRDNIMGTTTAGRIARGLGAAGALALAGGAARYGGGVANAASKAMKYGGGKSGAVVAGAKNAGRAIKRDVKAVRDRVGSAATGFRDRMSNRFKK